MLITYNRYTVIYMKKSLSLFGNQLLEIKNKVKCNVAICSPSCSYTIFNP